MRRSGEISHSRLMVIRVPNRRRLRMDQGKVAVSERIMGRVSVKEMDRGWVLAGRATSEEATRVPVVAGKVDRVATIQIQIPIGFIRPQK